MRHIRVKPYEFISVGAVTVLILYVLLFQLFFSSGVILPLMTVISLLGAFLYFGRIDFSLSYLAFIVFTSAVSLFITSSIPNTMTYIMTISKAFIFFLAVVNCLKFENGFKFVKISTIIAGIGLSLMLYGNSAVGVRVSASDAINENVVAASLLVSIIITVYEYDRSFNRIHKLFCLGTVALMAGASLFTGTRKVFISIIAFIALYLITSELTNDVKGKINIKKLLLVVIGACALYLFVSYALDTSILGDRFRNTGYEGDKMRSFFYLKAYEFFKENPFCGLGWGGFALRVGMYSHSTYAELIANTGIVGCFLYLCFCWYLLNRLRKSISNREDYVTFTSNYYKIAAISFCIILALGFGTVIFYEINITLVIAISYTISKEMLYENIR